MHCKCYIYCTAEERSCFAVCRYTQMVLLFPQAAHLNHTHFPHLPKPPAELTQHTSRWSKDPRWIQFAWEDRSSSAAAFCSAQPLPKVGISPVTKTPPALYKQKTWWRNPEPDSIFFISFPILKRFNYRLILLLKGAHKNTCIISSCM